MSAQACILSSTHRSIWFKHIIPFYLFYSTCRAWNHGTNCILWARRLFETFWEKIIPLKLYCLLFHFLKGLHSLVFGLFRRGRVFFTCCPPKHLSESNFAAERVNHPHISLYTVCNIKHTAHTKTKRSYASGPPCFNVMGKGSCYSGIFLHVVCNDLQYLLRWLSSVHETKAYVHTA